MKVTVFRDERTLARTLAVQIAATLGQHPATVLGLPTGRTPIRLYHELGSLHANGQDPPTIFITVSWVGSGWPSGVWIDPPRRTTPSSGGH